MWGDSPRAIFARLRPPEMIASTATPKASSLCTESAINSRSVGPPLLMESSWMSETMREASAVRSSILSATTGLEGTAAAAAGGFCDGEEMDGLALVAEGVREIEEVFPGRE